MGPGIRALGGQHQFLVGYAFRLCILEIGAEYDSDICFAEYRTGG